jgi:hypothetical protein
MKNEEIKPGLRVDEFEQRLQRQPLRHVPSAWREEILVAADVNRRKSPVRELTFAAAFPALLWRELIWPCRRIWVGLAPVWVALLVFNVTHADHNQPTIAKSTMPPGEMRLALQEQQRILTEIIGPQWQTPPAEPPRRPNNHPRSERRSVVMA